MDNTTSETIRRKNNCISLNKYQVPSPIETNHFMLCAMPQFLASAQHYYNHTVVQKKMNFV